MFLLVTFKINHGQLIFIHVHLTLSDAYDNQCFINCFIFINVNELCKPASVNFFFVGTKCIIPSGRDGPIFPAQVANQNTGFTSSYPIAEQANNITLFVLDGSSKL